MKLDTIFKVQSVLDNRATPCDIPEMKSIYSYFIY